MNTRSALSTYRNLDAQTGVVDADPHRLIQMLLDGAMDRLAQARGAMQAGETAAMGEAGGDHVRLAELGAELAELEVERSTAEEAWLELAAEVEERGLQL